MDLMDATDHTLNLEEHNLIELARTLSHPSNFSVHEELAQMKKARVIAVSSAYRHTYFYHRARIEPLYNGEIPFDVGVSEAEEGAKVVMRHLT